jgi:hypothetical protein
VDIEALTKEVQRMERLKAQELEEEMAKFRGG